VTECPKCGSELTAEDATCPACGCDVAGATASFQPVDAGAARLEEDVVEGPVLVVSKGPQLGERFFIEQPVLTVGRDPEADIFLNDMTVSRSHARFELTAGELSVIDLGSLNGTYVNGMCVDRAALSSGDVVQIGTFQMVYFSGAGAS